MHDAFKNVVDICMFSRKVFAYINSNEEKLLLLKSHINSQTLYEIKFFIGKKLH